MCYPKPGPRCSPRARKLLDEALAGGDTTAIKQAQRAYNLTPRGIRELRAAGEHDLADRYQKRRLQLIQKAKYTQAKVKLGVDIDNTMMDFTQGFRDYATRVAGLTAEQALERFPDPKFYKYVDAGWFESGQDFMDTFTAAEADGVYRKSKVYADVAATLKRLAADGQVEIHIVTARDKKWRKDTLAWLHANNIPFKSLTHTDAKEQTDMDIYIDDANYQLSKLRDHGKRVIAFDQAYNADMLDIPRVHNWSEVPAVIKMVRGDISRAATLPRAS